jgi:hypothetical protein
MAKAKAEGTVYDGTASDGQGRTVEPRFAHGQALRIKSNSSGLRDGGMEGCRLRPEGTPYIGADGAVRQTCRTETDEIVAVPEHALERDRAPERVSSRTVVSGIGNAYERIFGRKEPRKLSRDYCGAGCDGGARHSLDAHRAAGDPAMA